MVIFLLFPFIVGGLVVFLVCLAVPLLQRFALSAAMWFLALLPGLLLWLLIDIGASLGLQALSGHLSFPRWEMSFWHTFGGPAARLTLVVVGMLGTIVLASGVAVIHQFAIHRTTFALFRLYAGSVTATVAVVWGSLTGAVVASSINAPWEVAFVVTFTLVVALGWGGAMLGSRMARRLRGAAPKRLTWILEEEFYGLVEVKTDTTAG